MKRDDVVNNILRRLENVEIKRKNKKDKKNKKKVFTGDWEDLPEEERKIRTEILNEQTEYLHRNQNIWQSSEELKAIEIAVRKKYYDDENNRNQEQKK